MIEALVGLLIAGLVAMAIVAVLCVLWAIAYLVWWVLFLPFKLLGFAFKGLMFLLLLPVLLVVGAVATAIFGIEIIAALLPAALFVLLVWGVFRLMRPHRRSTVSATR